MRSKGVKIILTTSLVLAVMFAVKLNNGGSSNDLDTNVSAEVSTASGDLAGEQGTRRFIKNMPKDVMIDVIPIPQGKDVNDLSKDEFLKCFNQRYLL